MLIDNGGENFVFVSDSLSTKLDFTTDSDKTNIIQSLPIKTIYLMMNFEGGYILGRLHKIVLSQSSNSIKEIEGIFINSDFQSLLSKNFYSLNIKENNDIVLTEPLNVDKIVKGIEVLSDNLLKLKLKL